MMHVMAGFGTRAIARPSQSVSIHVRADNATIATLIKRSRERSTTFRNLLTTIDASDGIIYIEPGLCGGGMRTCFVNVTKAGFNRVLWVIVDVRGIDCDLMGLLGHELQHTVEVLGDPHVTSFAEMYNFYSREADPGGSFPFETLEAKHVGEAVRAEVRQQSRCTNVP